MNDMGSSKNTGPFEVCYSGFLADITRTFPSRECAEQWCRQIGKPELIAKIRRISHAPLIHKP